MPDLSGDLEGLTPLQRGIAERHWGQTEIASWTLGALFGFRVADGLMTADEAVAYLRAAPFDTPHARMVAKSVADALARGEVPPSPHLTVIDGGKSG